MELDLITKEDLQKLRVQIGNDMREILKEQKPAPADIFMGYKTEHIRKMLGCSVNKVKSLIASGKLRKKRIGGTNYYNKEDVHKLLEQGFK